MVIDVSLLIAIISVIGVIVSAIITNRYRKQVLADDEEQRLIETLQALLKAQDDKIAGLKDTINEQTQQISFLTSQINELREVIVSQALLIEELSKK